MRNMRFKRQTYVSFLARGEKPSSQEVTTRSITTLSVPTDVYAFYFYDIFSTRVREGGRDVELRSEPVNESSRHFIGGEVITREAAEQGRPETEMLLDLMIKNGCNMAIQTRVGTYMQFNPRADILLSPRLVGSGL